MVRMRTGTRRHERGGLTMIELLVAMSILLVGIYAVARGFPSLFGNLDEEKQRTAMVRLAEEQMERLKADAHLIPEAIAGHDPVSAAVIDPEVWPDESVDPPGGNPRDDLTWVLGETLRVPAAQAGAAFSAYTLNLGPATVQDPTSVGDYFQVFRLERLHRPDFTEAEWVMKGRPLEDDQFFLDSAGYLFAPTQYPTARVDYCWVDDTGTPHWVYDEVVTNALVAVTPVPVRAAELTTGPIFANVVTDRSQAKAMVRYTVMIGTPADVLPGIAVLERTYGATLLLPAEDAGAVIHVNYQLKTEPDSAGDPRRVPVVIEELTAPTQPPYRIDLKFGGIDDARPLFDVDLTGAPLADPVSVLVLDMVTGDTWTDVDPWIELDYVAGRLTLDWDDAGAPMTAAQVRGRELRLYYRTLDGNVITVEKAPDYFLEEAIMQTYQDPDPALDESDKVDYRYFTARPAPGDAAYTQLLFPASAAGQGVAVDYLAGPAAPYDRVSGEMHVVDSASLGIVLERPDVTAIVRVRGVSVKVRGWWHDARGRVQMVDLDTFLTPEPLL